MTVLFAAPETRSSTSRTNPPQRCAFVLAIGAVVLALGAMGCGLEVTQDRPTFEALEPHEKGVVETVLAELRGFNAQVERYTPYSISKIISRDKINVSFEGKIFFGNLGDELVHISPWGNLTAGQQELVARWFKTSVGKAKPIYEKLFYRFLAVSQGAKQYQYEALTVAWVFGNRSIFNVERDSTRETLSYYRHIGKQADMWTFVTNACKPILAQYGKIPFDKKYLNANLQTLANPDGPTGYMRYVCGWIERGKVDSVGVSLPMDLKWVPTIPALQSKESNPGG